jgi:hypothetical protein
MLRRFLPLPLAVLAALALASTAVAGGWAQVTVPNLPTDPPAGGETIIDLTVLQHGATPVSWPRLTVVATDASGAAIAAQAKASGPDGHYTATLTFPSAGEWTLSFLSPDLIMDGSATLNVAEAIVVAPAAATPALDWMPWALLLLVGAIAIASIAAFLRARDGLGAGRVPVRN